MTLTVAYLVRTYCARVRRIQNPTTPSIVKSPLTRRPTVAAQVHGDDVEEHLSCIATTSAGLLSGIGVRSNLIDTSINRRAYGLRGRLNLAKTGNPPCVKLTKPISDDVQCFGTCLGVVHPFTIYVGIG